MKKSLLIIFFLCLIFLFTGFLKIKAANYEVTIFENEEKILEIFEDFNRAYDYLKTQESDNNLAIRLNDEYVYAKYALVNFKHTNNCEDIDYFNEEGSLIKINPCLASEGILLDVNDNQIKLLLDNNYMLIDKAYLKIIPIEKLNTKISSYTVLNSFLYREIKTDLNNDFFTFVLNLSKAPSYLKEGESYFSYDEHYFYKDLRLLIEDSKNNNHEHAINKDNPYYNYFKYLPHRSITNYHFTEIEKYLKKDLFISSKLSNFSDVNNDNINDVVNRSQIHGEIQNFYTYQYRYGANALMMLVQAMYESSNGRSFSSYALNKLFSDAAFENEEDRLANRYKTIEDSIYSHARYYISQSYADITKNSYSGTHFGSKKSGINLNYSSDPFWSLKLVNTYARMDASLGFKDFNNYALGIIEDYQDLDFYSSPNKLNVIAKLKNVKELSVIILESHSDLYKIQFDQSFFIDKHYDFDTNIAYISKDAVKHIINPDRIKSDNYYRISFNSNEGLFKDGSNILTYVIKEGDIVSAPKAYLDSYELVAYEPELKEVTSNTTYTAVFKKINSIELINKKELYEIKIGERLDLRGLKLKINYDDNTTKIIDVDSTMIESYDNQKVKEEQVNIVFNGLKTKIRVKISDDKKQHLFTNKLLSILDGKPSIEDFNEFIKISKNIDYNYDFELIRKLDLKFKDYISNNTLYHIEKNELNLSLSGLYSATSSSLNRKYLFFKDTIISSISSLKENLSDELNNFISTQGLDYVTTINLDIKKNYDSISLNTPIIVSLDLHDNDPKAIYSVIRIDEYNDLYALKVDQSSNFLKFITKNTGSFIIVKRSSPNIFNGEDVLEYINVNTMDYNFFQIFIVSLIAIFMTIFILLISFIYYIRRIKYGKNSKNNR